MPYRRGRPPIDLSAWFRIATALTTFMIVPTVAWLFNFMQHGTRYKHRWRLRGLRRAVTVSNHTTFLDPVKIACLPFPRMIFQTLLEATVEFPALGTLIRLLGGVPIPMERDGYRKIARISEKAFARRRYLHFYPEGECFLYSREIMKFHSGAFRIAAELNIPVVPMVTVFSEGPFRPWSALGRSIPLETLVVLEPEHPAGYVRRGANGEISYKSVKEFAEAVRQKMQAEIDRRGGTGAFFRGQMRRIKGLND